MLDKAIKDVPNSEKLNMYEIYIARAAEIFGVPKTWEIYVQAIESSLPDSDVKAMCLKYAELERSLGEIVHARAIYVFASQFADPRSYFNFWMKWKNFEVQHSNEDTFREMLRIKRSVLASYNQFLKWRIQFLEKGIWEKLDFSPEGISSMVQVTDFKNALGPGMK